MVPNSKVPVADFLNINAAVATTKKRAKIGF